MNQKKILLIDDSRTALLAEQTLLAQNPYEFITATDGEEGVVTAIVELPDLILLDIVMPKMDGFEVCKELKRHPATKKIPIIMVTTRSESENVLKGFELGCNDYVTKPIDGLELISKIENLLAADQLKAIVN